MTSREPRPRLDVVRLPGDKLLIVLSSMPALVDDNPAQVAKNWSDWSLAREQFTAAGVFVLRFTHTIDINTVDGSRDQ